MKICEIAGNPVLLATYSMIKDILKYFITESSRINFAMANSLQHHKSLIELIEAKNEAEAVLMMKKHIEVVERILLDKIDKG
jgi:DNA-binding FadR family transcriptional regulator